MIEANVNFLYKYKKSQNVYWQYEIAMLYYTAGGDKVETKNKAREIYTEDIFEYNRPDARWKIEVDCLSTDKVTGYKSLLICAWKNIRHT